MKASSTVNFFCGLGVAVLTNVQPNREGLPLVVQLRSLLEQNKGIALFVLQGLKHAAKMTGFETPWILTHVVSEGSLQLGWLHTFTVIRRLVSLQTVPTLELVALGSGLIQILNQLLQFFLQDDFVLLTQ